ncbi:MAG: DUF1320 domain-containing protein [Nitrospirota bacterium]
MYITANDIQLPEEVLIRLTDDEGTGSVNADRVEAAISSAQSVVDCALSLLYKVPLTDPREVVKKLTADFAVYYLYQRTGVVPPEVSQSYDNADQLLSKLAEGIFRIEAPEPGPQFTSSEREFSRDTMEGF